MNNAELESANLDTAKNFIQIEFTSRMKVYVYI